MSAAADLLVVGRIATLAGDHGPGWVESIAVRGGRVVAAGREADLSGLAGPGSRRLRLAPDEVAIPALTDAHLHLAETAMARSRVDLAGVSGIEELVARVAAAADGRTEPGGAVVSGDAEPWILGAGWDPDRLGRWPTADDLERAAPGRRVALWAHDHHALLASARALAEAGVEEAGDPEGGVIRRDGRGRPTGVLHESAARLVGERVPRTGAAELVRNVRPLVDELRALGVVAVHDPGDLSGRDDLDGPVAAYRELAGRGELGLRVHASIRSGQLAAAVDAGFRSGDALGADPLGRLRLGWLKLFADGSLGSRTAAMLAPFEAPPGEPPAPGHGLGVWVTPPAELAALAARAAAAGITAQVHGIGDAAVRAALDALAPTVGRTALVPRVEHAQLVDPADVPRFGALGIAASVQPVHLRSDEPKARRLWGARAERSGYPLASLAASGALVPFGTDAPVEPIDPWPGIACAVTRSAPGWPEGTAPLGPTEALALWRAVRAACLDAPMSAGEPDRGRLVPGCRADLLALPAAALSEPVLPDGPLWHARPRLVLMDGAPVAGG